MSFASLEDLEFLLGRVFDTTESVAAQGLLDQATAAIQSWTRQTLGLAEDDTVRLAGTWRDELVLPERPIVDVTAVSVGGVALTDWIVTTDGITRGGVSSLQRDPVYGWCGPLAVVEVTYSHGFDPIPADIKAVCLNMTQRSLSNPVGVTSESIGSYSVTYDADAAPGAALGTEDEALLRRYRKTWV